MKSKKVRADLSATKSIRRGSINLTRSKRARTTVGRPKSGSLAIDTQAAIMDAALDLFAARSCVTVSTKEVAAAVGFNTALIYYYFGSKEELFRRCLLLAIERATTAFLALADNANAPQNLLNDWLKCHQKNFVNIRQVAKLSLDHSIVFERNEPVEEAMFTFRNQTETSLTTALQANRLPLSNFDLTQTTKFVMVYLDGVYFRSLVSTDFDPTSDFADLKAFLNARLNRETPPSRPKL